MSVIVCPNSSDRLPCCFVLLWFFTPFFRFYLCDFVILFFVLLWFCTFVFLEFFVLLISAKVLVFLWQPPLHWLLQPPLNRGWNLRKKSKSQYLRSPPLLKSYPIWRFPSYWPKFCGKLIATASAGETSRRRTGANIWDLLLFHLIWNPTRFLSNYLTPTWNHPSK